MIGLISVLGLLKGAHFGRIHLDGVGGEWLSWSLRVLLGLAPIAHVTCEQCLVHVTERFVLVARLSADAALTRFHLLTCPPRLRRLTWLLFYRLFLLSQPLNIY